MNIEVGKTAPTSIRVTDEDRARADRIIELGLADTFSDAIRRALALALLSIDALGVPMTARAR